MMYSGRSRIYYTDLNNNGYLKEEEEDKLKSVLLNLQDDMNRSISYLKNGLAIIDKKVDEKINDIQEEFDNRVELIKIELDRVKKQFHNELKTVKLDIINMNGLNKNLIQDDIDYYENKLKFLNNEIINGLSDEKLEEYSNDLKSAKKLLEKLNDYDFDLSIKISENMDIKLVSDLRYSFEYKSKNNKIQDKLKSGTVEIKDSYDQIIDLCVLPNNTLLASNYRTLNLFNDKFELIKTIDSIDNKSFRISGIACDFYNLHVYLSNHLNDEIIMTDMNLKKLKTTDLTEKNQISSIESPCFYNNKLFVPYRLKKEIKRFSENLILQKSFLLDYQPAQVKIANNLACVKPDEKTLLYFYDIDSFRLKSIFNNGIGRISEINGFVFDYCFNLNKIFCFNKNGELINVIKFDKINNNDNSKWDETMKYNGNIIYFNSNIVLTAQNEKKFIKIA